MGEVILGMPGQWANDSYEASDHYTTKIGGLPDWPAPDFAVRHNLLECSSCKCRLCLIAQIYAPISSKMLTVEERVIYVFGCVMPKCESISGRWRAFRVQKSVSGKDSNTPSHELFSSLASALSAPSTDWREDLWTFDSGEEEDDRSNDVLDLEELGKALSEAASLASHPKKQSCNSHPEATVKPPPISQTTRVADSKTPVLPCFYLYTQQEAFSRGVTSVFPNYTSLSIKENQRDMDDNALEETWEEENYEYDRALNVDRTYLKFKKRMDAFPEQCLRYLNGGKPLLATCETGDHGTCRLCGGSRHYEMQLMPPVLCFLQEATNDCQKLYLEGWNWMTLIVYTCSKSCSHSLSREKSEAEEWIITEEGIVAQYE